MLCGLNCGLYIFNWKKSRFNWSTDSQSICITDLSHLISNKFWNKTDINMNNNSQQHSNTFSCLPAKDSSYVVQTQQTLQRARKQSCIFWRHFIKEVASLHGGGRQREGIKKFFHHFSTKTLRLKLSPLLFTKHLLVLKFLFWPKSWHLHIVFYFLYFFLSVALLYRLWAMQIDLDQSKASSHSPKTGCSSCRSAVEPPQ